MKEAPNASASADVDILRTVIISKLKKVAVGTHLLIIPIFNILNSIKFTTLMFETPCAAGCFRPDLGGSRQYCQPTVRHSRGASASGCQRFCFVVACPFPPSNAKRHVGLWGCFTSATGRHGIEYLRDCTTYEQFFFCVHGDEVHQNLTMNNLAVKISS